MARLKKTITGWDWTDLKPGDLIPGVDGVWREVMKDEIDERGELKYTPTYISTSTNFNSDFYKRYLDMTTTGDVVNSSPFCWCSLPSITGDTKCCEGCPNNKNYKVPVNIQRYTNIETYVSGTGTSRDNIEESMRELVELNAKYNPQKYEERIEKPIESITDSLIERVITEYEKDLIDTMLKVYNHKYEDYDDYIKEVNQELQKVKYRFMGTIPMLRKEIYDYIYNHKEKQG